MADVTTHTFRGKASFAKVLPDQLSLNYSKDGKEWKIDLEISEDTVKEAKKLKIGDKIRRGEPYTKDDGTEKPAYLGGRPYLTFRQAELRRDGTPNNPIEIKDILGQPWPVDKEIGNESVIDLKFVITNPGAGKKRGIYPRAIRVLDHVPYERKTFTDIDENDPYYKAAIEAQQQAANTSPAAPDTFRKDFGLDGASSLRDELDDDLDDLV